MEERSDRLVFVSAVLEHIAGHTQEVSSVWRAGLTLGTLPGVISVDVDRSRQAALESI
jgi:hypothetical protein